MNEFAIQIGLMIRFHRKKAQLTQLGLAQLASIGKTAVFNLEKGNKEVQLSTLLSVLHVLNIKIEFTGPLMHLFKKGSHEKS
jgi:DNA-binding XRE family transcriptional regulator